MITTLLFDLGGVIVNTEDRLASLMLAKLGMRAPATLQEQQQLNKETVLFVNGLIPTPDYLALLKQYCPESITDAQLVEALLSVLTGIPMPRLLRLKQLRKHYRIVLLSNICDVVWQRVVEQLSALGFKPEDLFDQLFLSFQMQLAKPDPRIYQQVIRQGNLVAAETLYFDDRQENIDAGLAAGLQAVKVDENFLEDSEEYQQLQF